MKKNVLCIFIFLGLLFFSKEAYSGCNAVPPDIIHPAKSDEKYCGAQIKGEFRIGEEKSVMVYLEEKKKYRAVVSACPDGSFVRLWVIKGNWYQAGTRNVPGICFEAPATSGDYKFKVVFEAASGDSHWCYVDAQIYETTHCD